MEPGGLFVAEAKRSFSRGHGFAQMDLRSCWRFLKQPPIRVPRPLPMMAPLLLAVIRRCASR